MFQPFAKSNPVDEHGPPLGDGRSETSCRNNEKQSTMQTPLMPGNGAAPPRFRIGDLEVDVGKAEVTRADEKIALPKLPFDLLFALINAAPSMVTNEDLLQQVWPGLLVSPASVAQLLKKMNLPE